MGELIDVIENQSKGNIVSYYKENTTLLYNYYKGINPHPDMAPKYAVKPLPISKMTDGTFYFMTYKDESNWMQYSPIFFVDWKEFEGKIIGYGVNLNFIPFEVRAAIFDEMLPNLEEEDQINGISFEDMYKRLLRVGYEYSLVEYDIERIESVFHISVHILPRFLYSSHPKNKYDPKKLYSIWIKKLETRELRHQEIISQLADDLFKTTEEIEMKYDALSDHMKRFKRNHDKFGK